MPAPIKLLHIIASVDPRGGGPVEGIKQRGAWLLAHGHTVEVLSLDAPDAEWVRQFPLKVHATGPTWLGGYHWTPRLAPWLRQHAGDYDHIVINGLWQYHCAGAARVLRGMGLPYHVFSHGMLDPWFKRTYPLKHLKKWVYWLLAEHHTLRHARRVLFTTEEERRLARQSFSPYQVNEAVVSYGTGGPPPGASELAKDFHALHPELEGKHLLLYLSRAHVKKGCDLLIEAWARVAPQHPGAHLLIAGPGDPTTLLNLHAQARELHVAHRITWLGMVSGDAKWGAFYASRAFVLPSHQENFGIAVAEALACGLPVLISDKVNTWREINQDGAGFVAPDTTDGTADNVARWLALTLAEQTCMSDAARHCAASRYSVEAMAQSLLTTLRNSAATPIE
jgi:glycosyltransferase involved in cell wall biosynthesis